MGCTITTPPVMAGGPLAAPPAETSPPPGVADLLPVLQSLATECARLAALLLSSAQPMQAEEAQAILERAFATQYTAGGGTIPPPAVVGGGYDAGADGQPMQAEKARAILDRAFADEKSRQGTGPRSAGSLEAAQAVHITQMRDPSYLPSVAGDRAPNRSSNCGIASTVMALRLAGLDVPGAEGVRTQDVLDRARKLATGRNDLSDGTTDAQRAKLARAGGARTELARGSAAKQLQQAMEWARSGIPVVLNGNSATAWGTRLSARDVSRFDGRHSVTLTYDHSLGAYVVNDPLSHVGAFTTTPAELRSYFITSVPDGGGRSRWAGSAMAVMR